jgi:hypothetical protein
MQSLVSQPAATSINIIHSFMRSFHGGSILIGVCLGAAITGILNSFMLTSFSSLVKQELSLPTMVTLQAETEPPKAPLFPDSCPSATISAFDKIYKTGMWWGKIQPLTAFYSNATLPSVRRKSASGKGSDLGIATSTSLRIIQKVIRDHNVTSMIDIPCGDANWIFDARETDSLKLYIGLDIVRAVIDVNKQRFAHHSNKIFRVWDGSICPLPRYVLGGKHDDRSVDLVHSRDVLQHLPLDQAVQFICNVFLSGARFFVTTTFPNGGNNNISGGDYYRNDLFSHPFNLMREGAACTPTHPRVEPDDTCVFDLTQPWIATWIKSKNCGGVLV